LREQPPLPTRPPWPEADSPRLDAVLPLPTLAALRRHVLDTLCGHDQLDPDQTPLREELVVRSGRSCGLFFHVQGLCLVTAYALWAGEENRILF
jgi:hypothetical protein